MDKSDGEPKKLLRPTAALKSKAGTSEPVESKKGASENGSSVVTEDFLKKIASSPIPHLAANRPGRLISFRGERDLTLGAAKFAIPAVAGTSIGKPNTKRTFAPTIPTQPRRGKTQDVQQNDESQREVAGTRGRGRRDGPGGRGRGRGKPELIQVNEVIIVLKLIIDFFPF